MNNVVLVGRITKDPECDEKESGKKLTNITVAVQRPFKNADNLYDTDFIRCVLWNSIAESAAEYCKTGDVIGVKGRLETQTYEDKEGNVRYSMQVVAERISFLASKKTKISETQEEEPC